MKCSVSSTPLANNNYNYNNIIVNSMFDTHSLNSFQDITGNLFCNFSEISHAADLQSCYFNLELTFKQYWWHVKCLLRKMLLEIASYGSYRNIMEFPRVFNSYLKLIWDKSLSSQPQSHTVLYFGEVSPGAIFSINHT